jgi:hypothetical protein
MQQAMSQWSGKLAFSRFRKYAYLLSPFVYFGTGQGD